MKQLFFTSLSLLFFQFLKAQANQFSVSCDGVNDYVDVPDDAFQHVGAGSMTYEGWFKKPITAHSQQAPIINSVKASPSGVQIEASYGRRQHEMSSQYLQVPQR